ncbi:MAG: hypothetical protein HY902_00850 [Deltaproteobacteria bacterium]|nr:hypothetical protein [Deltaproteobacteria bacterium]
MGHSVCSHPVDEPDEALSLDCEAAHSKPVPEMLVLALPFGQPPSQQHSDSAVLMAI